jgi:hypothetical protein
MVQLWSCLLVVLASLCVVHTKPYPEEKHRALLRTGYIHVPGFGYYRSVRHHLSDNCCLALPLANSLCGCVCVCVCVCMCVCVCLCVGDRVSGIH